MENDALVQALLNKALPPKLQAGDLPLPEQPPGFRTDPHQAGLDPTIAKALFEFLQLAPNLRGRLNSVTKGPSPHTMRIASDLDRPIEEFPLGIDAIVNRIGGDRIAFSPDLPQDQAKYVLGHELGHIVGMTHESPELGQLESAIDPDKAAKSNALRQLLQIPQR